MPWQPWCIDCWGKTCSIWQELQKNGGQSLILPLLFLSYVPPGPHKAPRPPCLKHVIWCTSKGKEGFEICRHVKSSISKTVPWHHDGRLMCTARAHFADYSQIHPKKCLGEPAGGDWDLQLKASPHCTTHLPVGLTSNAKELSITWGSFALCGDRLG